MLAKGAKRMRTGISSACYYPMETEQALEHCGRLGFRNLELFINCGSEMHGEYFDRVIRVIREYDFQIGSLHPYTSFLESYMLFGPYERRVGELIDFYRHYFDFCNVIGADKLVFHGGSTDAFADNEVYFDRYAQLHRAAQAFGVKLTHENVVKKRSQSPRFMKALADYIGPDFAMTLDIKQCRRAGEDPYEFIRLLGKQIVNVHVSDVRGGQDCAVPFTGSFAFEPFVRALHQVGYRGNYIIELYRDCYGHEDEIQRAARQFDELLRSAEQKSEKNG